jgi:nitrite reductase/ring-hydroxylating ferredoxin subunit
MRWIEIDQSKLTEKTIQLIRIEDKQLVLIKFKKEVFVTSSKCPHAGADISQGWCTDDGNLVCPFHRYEYQLNNGRGKLGQGDYLKTYPVKVENDKIYVGFKYNWWNKLFH